MRLLALLADPLFVSVEPSVVPWLVGWSAKALRLVVGSNVGQNPSGFRQKGQGSLLTVAVFGVTEGPRGARERDIIVEMARRAANILGRVRIVSFGRGTGPEAGRWLDAPGVEVETHGLVTAGRASFLLSNADVMLCVRNHVSSRRGTVVAAIAHGLPVVGHRGEETAPPITEAGVLLFKSGDIDGMATALVHIAQDPVFAAALRRRSVETYYQHFSWARIAECFLQAFDDRRLIHSSSFSVATAHR